jgi:hypothetical protein
MPSIKLTDQLGAGVDAEINSDSTIAKYIKDLSKLKFSKLNFEELKNVTLDQAPLKSLKTGIEFEQPVNIGVDDAEMKIGAGVSGSLTLLSTKDEQIFDPEVFADPIKIGPNQIYVGVGVSASVSSGLTHETGDLSFGFDAGSRVSLTSFRLFESAPGGAFPKFVDAVKASIASFSIPGDLEDLEKLPVGSISVVEGNGSIKLSGSLDVLSVVNPLAVVSLPDPLGELKVSSGNAIKVGASFEITGAYQIRVHKTGQDKVRLGYYKKRGTEFSVKASASAGLSASVGNFDLIEQVFKAISSDPKVDIETLKKGGLSDTQIEAIKKVFEAGISRKLEIALGFEFSSQDTSEAAFLFDFELDRLDEAGRKALHNALDGDLSGLTANKAGLPAGVQFVRSIFTEIQKKRHALKFNLLGIYNFISVSTLTLKGRVLFDRETGEIIITDTATASRIAASTLNFAADNEKLRKVMAESVLMTVAYKFSNLVTHAQPELAITHSYFELHSNTSTGDLRNNLDVFEALGLLEASEKNDLLGGASTFGKTTLFAETSYDDALVNSLFLNNGSPRSQGEYETFGRKALALLVQSDEQEAFRRKPAIDDVLWKEMSKQGQPNLKFIDGLKTLNSVALAVVTTDYTVIKWWAESMEEMSKSLAEMRKFLDEHPDIDPANKKFKSLRRKLGSKLKEVASGTKRQFGDPWGLVAMDQAAGGRAGAKALITGPSLAVFRERKGFA